MQELERTLTLAKKVSDITKRINNSRGEPVLCFRDFSTPGEVTGDLIPPISNEYQHYEAGVINGKVRTVPGLISEMITLEEPFGRWGSETFYSVIGSHLIPIDRKLEGFVNFGFRLDIENLEKIGPGEILIDEIGVDQTMDTSLYQSHLRSFNLLIGSGEIENFLEGRKIKNYHELLDILKNPEERIEGYYHKKRDELDRNLVITANNIANLFRSVQALEKGVMHANWVPTWDEDGHSYHGWDKFSGRFVQGYQKLREDISHEIRVLGEYLKEGTENPRLYVPRDIGGIIIGFPGRTTFDSYSAWIKDSLFKSINETFERLDTHLTEERDKSNSKAK